MPSQPYDKSNHEMLGEGGYDSMHEFVHSYGLKSQPSNYEEARDSPNGFREIGQHAWDEQHGYQSDEDWDEYDEQESWEFQYYEKELGRSILQRILMTNMNVSSQWGNMKMN